MDKGARFGLLIDDSAFFYVYVGKIGVNAKKARTVISNYLQSIFPVDMFAGFAVLEDKGTYVALVYRSEFAAFLEEEAHFFRAARKISTVLCEAFVRYDSFFYTDGQRVYEKGEQGLEIVPSAPDKALKASDLQDDVIPLKCDIELPGIKRTADPLSGTRTALIFAAVCYLLFLASQIMGVMAENKSMKSYEAVLNGYYEKAGVADSADPYGLLRSRVSKNGNIPFRVMDVLNELGKAVDAEIEVDSLTLNERLVRIEGFAKDFAGMEKLKSGMESHLNKAVTVEDSRQSGELVKFIIRYEP